jgi:hypothetical protein
MDTELNSFEETNSYLPTPILAIRHAVCFTHLCWAPFPSLKCTRYKRVSYCSKKCQQADWKWGHKKTGKILEQSNNLKTLVPSTGRSWEQYRKEKLRSLIEHHSTPSDPRSTVVGPEYFESTEPQIQQWRPSSCRVSLDRFIYQFLPRASIILYPITLTSL